MDDYTNLCRKILKEGKLKSDRTGTGTISIFGAQMRFDLRDKFPLLTHKKVNFSTVLKELIWFISGNTNINILKENKVNIWNEWADENGDLGPVYGYQWRNWIDKNGNKVDQIKELEKNLKEDPYSRRHILTAWNVGDIKEMALPPCHMMVQFYVSDDNKLSAQLYQRSADIFLGVPFNIACYSAMIHMFANVLDLEVGEFVHTIGDAHIYSNHVDQVKEMLNNDPYELPTIKILNKRNSITEFVFEDIIIEGYKSHKFIKAPVAI